MNQHKEIIDSILSPDVNIEEIETWLQDSFTDDRKQLYEKLISETELWIIDTCRAFDKSVYESLAYLISIVNMSETDYQTKHNDRNALLIAHRNIERDHKQLFDELNQNAKTYGTKENEQETI